MSSQADSHRGKRTMDTRLAAQLFAGCVLLAGMYALLHRVPRETQWQSVPGSVQGTRIVTDHALEAPGGSQLTWRAEYSVAYSVGDHEYQVWADSGVRGESEADVRLNLVQPRPSCQVRYNPERPEVSIADCR
jgi:hypothetical protein